jgi:hypothetical protein
MSIHPGMALACLALLLSACEQEADEPQAQRVAFGDASRALLTPLNSPDTSEARWLVDEGGQAISFGNEGERAMLTLDCRLSEDPAQMRIVRHVRARPGQGALLPVIGNGMISRFLVDAKLEGGEWRWEGTVRAADPMLDVFTGPRPLTATLPGGGLLEIGGSRVPGEFVTWCRAGGDVMQAEAEEQEDAPAEPDDGRTGEPVNRR